jgi:hypothetical protein
VTEFVVRRTLICIITWIAVQAAGVCAAIGCPVCDTATGDQVRAGILDENFGRTLLAVVLPFPILLGVVALIHFGGSGHAAGGRTRDDL